MTPEQTHATRQAENYRDREAEILAQIERIEASNPTPADKKFISQQRKLAERNRSRARNWQEQADGEPR